MREALADMLVMDEGLRLKVYDDHNGVPIKKGTKVEKYPTIGDPTFHPPLLISKPKFSGSEP